MDVVPALTKRPVGATGVGAAAVKHAVTYVAAFIVTEQLPVPAHAPLQPANVAPLVGVAVKVTTVPLVRFAWHKLVPAGQVPLDGPYAYVTVPLPVPPVVLIVNESGGAAVAADTSFE